MTSPKLTRSEREQVLECLAWADSQGGRVPIDALAPVTRKLVGSVYLRQLSHTYVELTSAARDLLEDDDQ